MIDDATRRIIHEEVAKVTGAFIPGAEIRQKFDGLESVLTSLYGPPIPEVKGGGRDTKAGMEWKLAELYRLGTTNGFAARTSRRDKIILATITSATTLVAAYLAFLTAIASSGGAP